jgi:transglutaminase-like putative cysteine protease
LRIALSDTPQSSPLGLRNVKLIIRAMDPAGQVPAESLPVHLSAIRRHFEISLYFLLLTGVLTLVSTGKLDLFTIFALPAAMLYKGYRWWHGKGPELSNRIATWFTIAYFIFFPFDLWIISRMLATGAQNPALYAALLATIHLMLFATIIRLYSAATTRDYLFLTMMGFTSMLAAAILTVDTVFLAFFFIFLGLAVSTFVALEMWRSAQGAVTRPMESGTSAAGRLHNALAATSTAIAFGSLAVGAIIFLILPRISGGYMSGLNMQPTMISGFSDDVELGELGEIKKNSTVIMRVTVDGGLEAAHGVHWRGVALTKFDGRRWYNEPHEPTTLTAPGEGGWFRLDSDEAGAPRKGISIHYKVLLEPIGSTALFFANEAQRARGRFSEDVPRAPFGQRRTYLLKDFTGSIFNPYHSFTRMEYEANSLLPTPPLAAVRQAGAQYPDAIRDTYLQLPALDARIPQLAQQITARDTNPYDQARSIEAYLRSRYGYTLDLSGPPQADPLAYFLFQRRAGHCEYFAAAMTVMLRTLGVPARYINGFQTGEYNDVAGDLVVRASDAHSWVEAYFPGFGWLSFDPTPASNDERRLGLLDQLSHYWDWFQLQWGEWVINYDFIHQITVAQNLGRFSRDWAERIRTDFSAARRRATERLRLWQYAISRSLLARVGIVVFVGAFALAVVLLRPEVRRRITVLLRTRVVPAREMTPHLATLQYREMLRVLELGGYRKVPTQTPMEFATSFMGGTLGAPIFELTSIYQAARYGGKPADPQQASSLIDRIRAFLRKK